jgi:hypothetical protein
MKTNRRVTWCHLKWMLGAALVPVLIASASVRARADEDEDDEDDQVQVLKSDNDNQNDDAADRAREQRERAEEERERAREQRERQREQARAQAEQARDEARQRAEEARQRKEEEKQRKEEEKQRVEEERERAKEEKQRAKEELERTKEEKQRAKEEQRCRDHDDEDCNGGGGGGGGAGGRGDKKSGRTSAKVKGPVRFSVDVVNADIQVSATSKDTVSISAKGCAPDDLELDGNDDEFEADFSEWGSCEGPVVVLLPSGSSVELTTVQGSLKLTGTYKEIEASSVAGSIEIEAGDDVQAEAVQGKVKIGSARRVHVESVAGDVELTTTGTSPIVEVETVNGNVRWTGACAKGCRASIETFQGSSILTLDPKASSFELRFATQNGKFNDGLGTQASGNRQNVKGFAPVRAKYGKAEGTLRVETYQGGLELKKRP